MSATYIAGNRRRLSLLMKRQRRRRTIGEENSLGAETLMPLPTVEQVVDVGRLQWVFHDRKNWAGEGAGVDGLSWCDIGRSEAASVFRSINRQVLAGTYRPAPERCVLIPREGRTSRRLDIGTVVNRTVAASLADLLAPRLDRVAPDVAYAYRSNRGHLHMLARLARLASESDRWVLVNVDVAQAFPSVRIDDALEAHRSHGIDEPRLLALIETILRGAEGTSRTVGLSQGNPYAPSAFEITMNSALIQGDNEPPRLRYADNLVSLCRSVPEARIELERYRDHLSRYGLTLKESATPDEPQIVDMKGGSTTQLLGFRLAQRNGAISFDIHETKWLTLFTSLEECHSLVHPAQQAMHIIQGWISSHGPGLENDGLDAHVHRLHAVTCQLGFDLPDPNSLLRWCRQASINWTQTLQSAVIDR
jgi:hypothetical protein